MADKKRIHYQIKINRYAIFIILLSTLDYNYLTQTNRYWGFIMTAIDVMWVGLGGGIAHFYDGG